MIILSNSANNKELIITVPQAKREKIVLLLLLKKAKSKKLRTLLASIIPGMRKIHSLEAKVFSAEAAV